MTPARLSAMLDVETYFHDEAEKAGNGGRKPAPSTNPAADLAALARMS